MLSRTWVVMAVGKTQCKLLEVVVARTTPLGAGTISCNCCVASSGCLWMVKMEGADTG